MTLKPGTIDMRLPAFFEKTIVRIFLTLIIILVAIFIVLCLLGVQIDKAFLIEILKGILANTFVFFIAVFCIDHLNKIDQRKKFKRMNRQTSEFIFLKTTALLLILGEQIGIFDKKQNSDEFAQLLQGAPIPESIEKTLNNQTLFAQKFYSAYNSAKNKQEFFELFTKTAKDFLDVIQKNLKEIYPHRSDEVDTILEEILTNLGILCGSHDLFKLTQSLKDSPELQETDFTNEDFENFEKGMAVLTDFVYKTALYSKQTEAFFKKINLLKQKAEKNELFSDV